MPINPNIALGVQPIQQPNMLAQMGQALALKAAAQDTEGYEGVKGAITGGMSPNDPRLLQYGKRGIEVYKAGGEGLIKQQEALAKSFANAREGLNMVRTPDELLAYSVSQFNDPIIGPSLRARGLTPETVAANLQKELSTSGFDTVLKKSAMGLDGWYKDQTTRANAATSAAPGHRQASVAEQRLKMEQDELKMINNILRGGVNTPSSAVTPPVMVGGGGGGGRAATPIAIQTAPVAGAVTPPVAGAQVPVTSGQPNVLADQVAPQAAPATSVNALNAQPQPQIVDQISQLIRLGSPKAIQAADALIKEYNIRNPAGKIEQDADGNLIKINERTSKAEPVIGPDGKPVKGSSPYESAFTGAVGKAQAERNEKVVTAAQAASANIQKIDSAIELLKTGDATTGLGAELRNNIDRARALFAGDIKAGKKVADTQILDALLGSDVFSMIQSLGIGARGLDTPAERDYLRQVMTGTIQMDNKALIRLSEIRRNIETRAIEKYNTQLEKGELNKYFETQGIKPEKIEIPKTVGGSNTVSVGGNTYTFPNAEAAAKFKKDAGIK